MSPELTMLASTAFGFLYGSDTTSASTLLDPAVALKLSMHQFSFLSLSKHTVEPTMLLTLLTPVAASFWTNSDVGVIRQAIFPPTVGPHVTEPFSIVELGLKSSGSRLQLPPIVGTHQFS
jgi:hypothetical protein